MKLQTIGEKASKWGGRAVFGLFGIMGTSWFIGWCMIFIVIVIIVTIVDSVVG